MRLTQPRYKFPVYLRDVTRMGRVYSLKLWTESIVISSTSASAVAQGYATLMCVYWARDGWNCQGMMEITGREFLAEVGLPAKLLPVMMEVASKYPVPECKKLQDDYDWEANSLPPYYL